MCRQGLAWAAKGADAAGGALVVLQEPVGNIIVVGTLLGCEGEGVDACRAVGMTVLGDGEGLGAGRREGLVGAWKG